MPALVLYGYRTIAAGDDLGILCISFICLHLIQAALAIPTLVFTTRSNDSPIISKERCEELGYDLTSAASHWDSLMHIYSLSTMVFALTSIFVDTVTLKTSYTGTPTEPKKRKALKSLCTIRLGPMAAIRLCIGILAWVIVSVVQKYCNCVGAVIDATDADADFLDYCTKHSVWYDCLLFLAISQTFEVGFDGAIVLHGFYKVTQERIAARYGGDDDDDDGNNSENKWKNRCLMCCRCTSLMTCCLFGGNKVSAADFSSVAIALADFMADHGTIDTTYSDIAAGLAMLLRVQKERKLASREALIKAKEEEGVPSTHRRSKKSIARSKLGIKRTVKPKKGSNRTITSTDEVEDNIAVGAPDESGNVSDVHEEEGIDCHPPEEPIDLEGDDIESRYANVEKTARLPEKGEEGVIESWSFDSEDSASLSRSTELKMMQNAAKLEEKIESGDIDDDVLTGRDAGHVITYRFVHENSEVITVPHLRRVLSPKNQRDRSALAEGARFSRVALAIYTWLMYVFNKPCTGPCVLGCARCIGTLRCKRKCRRRDTIISDDICGCNESALLVTIGIEESDIVYAQFSNQGCKLPYCIVIDQEWDCVVIAIRGTLSIDDLIRDITISPYPLDECGEKYGFDGKGEHCHNGMLESAEWIYNDIQSHGVLDGILKGESSEFAGFKLRVIGHSLGAGVAAILALMLRQKYPDLRGLCFSPPGCVFSQKTAHDCKDFITSYALNRDIVPRLCLESLENMRDEVLELITRIKIPKHNITRPSILNIRGVNIVEANNKMLYEHNSIPPSKFKKDLESFRIAQRTRKQNRGVFQVQMFPPANCVYLSKTSDDKSCLHDLFDCATCSVVAKNVSYSARWSHYDDFQEILISPSMLTDHFPQNVCHELERIAESFGIDFPFNDYKCAE